MPVLHWFHSLGTQGKQASYVLTAGIARRFRDAGCLEALPPEAEMEADHPPVRARSAESPTPAMVHLLGPLAPGWSLQLHTVETPALREARAGGPSPTAQLERELPSWALGSPRRTVEVRNRGPQGSVQLVEWLLNTPLHPGDALFFEAAGGLRPIQMVLTFGAELLRLVNPAVRVVGTSYAEFGVQQRPDGCLDAPCGPHAAAPGAGGKLSPVYDLSDLLALPAWAAAGADLRDRMDGARLLALQESLESGAEGEALALREFCTALHLGWPDEAADPLRRLAGQLSPKPDEQDHRPERALVRRVLREQVTPLARVLPPPDSPSTSMDAVRFQLAVADALVATGRLGDAVRLLREVLVTRMELALNPGHASPSYEARRQAAWAFRSRAPSSIAQLWDEVRTLRNAASHANMAAPENKADLRKLAAALTTAGEPLHHRVRVTCEDAPAWSALGAPVASIPVLWLGLDGGGRPPDRTARSWNAALEGFAAASIDKKIQPARRKAASAAAEPRFATLPRPRLTPPGSDWLFGRIETKNEPFIAEALRAGAVEHVVVYGAVAPTVLCALVQKMTDLEVFVWVWTCQDPTSNKHGELHPCFDRAFAQRMRGGASA